MHTYTLQITPSPFPLYFKFCRLSFSRLPLPLSPRIPHTARSSFACPALVTKLEDFWNSLLFLGHEPSNSKMEAESHRPQKLKFGFPIKERPTPRKICDL